MSEFIRHIYDDGVIRKVRANHGDIYLSEQNYLAPITRHLKPITKYIKHNGQYTIHINELSLINNEACYYGITLSFCEYLSIYKSIYKSMNKMNKN